MDRVLGAMGSSIRCPKELMIGAFQSPVASATKIMSMPCDAGFPSKDFGRRQKTWFCPFAPGFTDTCDSKSGGISTFCFSLRIPGSLSAPLIPVLIRTNFRGFWPQRGCRFGVENGLRGPLQLMGLLHAMAKRTALQRSPCKLACMHVCTYVCVL